MDYSLPIQKSNVDYFKIMKHDIFECEKRTIPNIIMTFTSRNEIFVWQENLMNVIIPL
jgi:hypothetical protein